MFYFLVFSEPYLESQVLHATFLLLKHQLQPLDLVAVDIASGARVYSFLSVTWGLISDIDIESERFRNMGNFRFTVGALIRISGKCFSNTYRNWIIDMKSCKYKFDMKSCKYK